MDFAVAVYAACRLVRDGDETRDIGRQLRRSASSVAANYRALCRAGTDPAFVAKANTLIEEADECAFWLDFAVRVGVFTESAARPLRSEANELLAIFVASKRTIRARMQRNRHNSAHADKSAGA